MGKGWGLFFGVVLLATFLLWVVAFFIPGWWLPPNIASYGGAIDNLFYLILGFTGFFLVLTHGIQVWAMYRYPHQPGRKATYTHGNHKLEVLWTAIPAGILLFIAFAQVQAWANIKYQSRMPPPDLVMQVTARQWEWRVRYPTNPDDFTYTADSDAYVRDQANRNALNWAEHPQIDDLHAANEVHCWMGANVKIYLKTLDILHSLYFPTLRLKQDAVPGRTIPMWFRATQYNVGLYDDNPDAPRWELYDPVNEQYLVNIGFDRPGERAAFRANHRWEFACAELCGGRHYAMRGQLYVHKDKEDYMRWFNHALRQQNAGRAPVTTKQPGAE